MTVLPMNDTPPLNNLSVPRNLLAIPPTSRLNKWPKLTNISPNSLNKKTSTGSISANQWLGKAATINPVTAKKPRQAHIGKLCFWPQHKDKILLVTIPQNIPKVENVKTSPITPKKIVANPRILNICRTKIVTITE